MPEVPRILLLLLSVGDASPTLLRSEALALTNHPLVVALGVGNLPAGSANRLLLARAAVIEGLEAGAANAAANAESEATLSLLSLVNAEKQRCEADAEEWLASAAAAGITIDLPAAEVDAGVRCYSCGGLHYNVDCPDEASVAPEATALAGALRAGSLAASATVLHSLCFAVLTLQRAGLDGGDAYRGLVGVHAVRLVELADACDLALEAVSGGSSDVGGEGGSGGGGGGTGGGGGGGGGGGNGNDALAAAEASTASSLLYALVDSESGTAGLKSAAAADGAGEAVMSLQDAREKIEAVESGFLQTQDRNAQFLREEVLGAKAVVAPPASSAQRKAAATDAAAAYLAAKRAGGQPVGKDAAAAIAAKGGGPKAQAAAKYLALRKKQQAAEAYLAARKKAEDMG